MKKAPKTLSVYDAGSTALNSGYPPQSKKKRVRATMLDLMS